MEEDREEGRSIHYTIPVSERAKVRERAPICVRDLPTSGWRSVMSVPFSKATRRAGRREKTEKERDGEGTEVGLL